MKEEIQEKGMERKYLKKLKNKEKWKNCETIFKSERGKQNIQEEKERKTIRKLSK